MKFAEGTQVQISEHAVWDEVLAVDDFGQWANGVDAAIEAMQAGEDD